MSLNAVILPVSCFRNDNSIATKIIFCLSAFKMLILVIRIHYYLYDKLDVEPGLVQVTRYVPSVGCKFIPVDSVIEKSMALTPMISVTYISIYNY